MTSDPGRGNRIPRRRFLGGLAGAVALAGCGKAAPPHDIAQDAAPRPDRDAGGTPPRIARIAHLTDIHVQPEREAPRWMAACLQRMQRLADPPDIVFNGGDAIMDALGADAERTRIQWDIFTRLMREECSLPVVHCIGNHDIWGWDRSKSGALESDPLYGKNWVMETLEMESRHYWFDLENWRVFVLDSTHIAEERVYIARLDEEQFAWLESELARVPHGRHVMIFSHIPILSASAYFDGDNETSGNWVVPGRWMHIDARRIKDLFFRHPAVRLAISGHIHLLDRVEYNGVTYLCNGAVSGNWWKGVYQETAPGFALVNLYEDGSFDSEYVGYGWREVDD